MGPADPQARHQGGVSGQLAAHLQPALMLRSAQVANAAFRHLCCVCASRSMGPPPPFETPRCRAALRVRGGEGPARIYGLITRLGALDELLRRRVELVDHVLHLRAGSGVIEIFIFSASARNCGSCHGGVEGRAQDVDLFGRRAGRRDVGALEHLLADDEFGDLAVVGVGDELPDVRNAELGEFGCRLERDLHQHVELLVAHPIALLRFHARPVPAAHAVDLAALHRERDVDRALVAGDDLEFGAGGVIVQIGIVAGRAAGGARAENGLAASARPRRS